MTDDDDLRLSDEQRQVGRERVRDLRRRLVSGRNTQQSLDPKEESTMTEQENQ